MPGLTYVGTRGGHLGSPSARRYPIGNSLSIYEGDVLALTTVAALTASGVVVCRTLLAADKTANYKEGTPVAGVLGVAPSSVTTNSSGVATSVPAPAGVATGAGIVYALPGMAGSNPPDKVNGRSELLVHLAVPGNIFRAKLDATSSAGTMALKNTLAGLILTTSGGITTFTIHTGAAAADKCLRIIDVDVSDALYGSVGCAVFVEFLESFSQSLIGVNYATQ